MRLMTHVLRSLLQAIGWFQAAFTAIVGGVMWTVDRFKTYLMEHGFEFLQDVERWELWVYGGAIALIVSMWWAIARLSQPYLVLRCNNACITNPNTKGGGTARYLSVEAENKYGPRANECRAILSRIDKLSMDGQWISVSGYERLNIRLPWAWHGESEYDLIVGVPHLFNLICVADDNELRWPDGLMQIQRMPIGAQSPPQKTGLYRSHISIGSKNGSSANRRQKVKWYGCKDGLDRA